MNKHTEQSNLTKANLREAFWQLYAHNSISRITVGAVCEKAGYNRGTFYLHYQDIYELLESIEDEILDGMTNCAEGALQKLSKDNGKRARIAALTEVVRYYEKNKQYVDVMLSKQSDSDFIVRLKNRLKPLWRSYLVHDTYGRSESEIDLILEYTLSGALFMISQWLQEPGTVSATCIGKLVFDAAIRDIDTRIAG